MPDTVTEVAETAGSGCTECMNYSVKRSYTAKQQGNKLKKRQADIQRIKDFSGLSGLRNQFAE